MRDNVSIIIAAILCGILIILLPLVSILERQDNMTYNVALTLTTNFVEEVREKGFIDKNSYDEYMDKMSRTGCIYKYEIEAHKKIIIPATNNDGSLLGEKYEEDTIITTKAEIEQELTNTATKPSGSAERNSVFLFDEGDKFYVRVKNTNSTSASILYKFIAGESNEKVVDITFGGNIDSINWKLYDQTVELQTGKAAQPEITFSIPQTKIIATDTISPVNTVITELMDPSYEDGSVTFKEYQYTLDLNLNSSLIYDFTLRNFEEFYTDEGIKDNLSPKYIEEYLVLNNFKGIATYYDLNDLSYGKPKIKTNETSFNKVDGAYRVRLEITGIVTEALYETIGITIKPGLGSGNGYNSSGYDSPTVSIINDYTKHLVRITGPYLEKTNKTVSKVFYNGTNTIGQDIYFLIEYFSVGEAAINHSDTPQSILDKFIIKDNSSTPYEKIIVDDTITYGAQIDGIIKKSTTGTDYVVPAYERNDAYRFGKIKVSLQYINDTPTVAPLSSSKTHFVELQEGWIDEWTPASDGATHDGSACKGMGAELKNRYMVKKDDKAPEKDLLVHTLYPVDNEYKIAPYNTVIDKYEIADETTLIKLDPEEIIDKDASGDIGSGLTKIRLRNGTTGTWTEFEYKKDSLIDWNLPALDPHATVPKPAIGDYTIQYELEDAVGNKTTIKTLNIRVIQKRHANYIKGRNKFWYTCKFRNMV